MAAGLQRAVQCLVNGTSSCFVSQPTPSAVLENALISLTRFKNACRWKEYWMLKNDNGSDSLGTGLRPVRVALELPQGSRQLEQFLHDVDFEVLTMLKHGNEDYAHSPRFKAVKGLIANLQGQDQVVVPTD
jgi:hypothetical protein